MSLQFTRVSSFACRGGLRKSQAGCSAVGLYCVTIPWLQIRKGSLYITVAGVLLHATIEQGCQVGPFGAKFQKFGPKQHLLAPKFRLALWLFFGPFPG